jgi:hypothetical protein
MQTMEESKAETKPDNGDKKEVVLPLKAAATLRLGVAEKDLSILQIAQIQALIEIAEALEDRKP